MHSAFWHARWFRRILYALIFAVAAVVLGLRYWILPNIDGYRPQIESMLSSAMGSNIQIAKLEADWQGLRPHLTTYGLTVFDPQKRPAIYLERIDSTLSWWSVFTGEIRFAELDFDSPVLYFRRNKAGVIDLAGIPLNQSSASTDTSMADWLLRQGRLDIRQARLIWLDEQRSNQPLMLEHVQLVLQNSFSRHKFLLQAKPPAELASMLDIRGNLKGKRFSEWDQWKGEVFTRLDYTSLPAWRTWLPESVTRSGIYPDKGRGGVRAWFGIADGRVSSATVDLALADVRAHLSKTVPVLPLKQLTGRVSWSLSDKDVQVATDNLKLSLANGVALPPLSLSLLLNRGKGTEIVGGKLQADHLPLEPLTKIAQFLPLPEGVEDPLMTMSPSGSLDQMSFEWAGQKTLSSYKLDGQFNRLASKPWKKMPGITGISGRVNLDQTKGQITLNGNKTVLDWPSIFAVPLSTDRLSSQLHWQKENGQWLVTLDRVALEGPEAEGEFAGRYRTEATGPGWIDLRGGLRRGAANAVWKYLPLVVDSAAREWLKTGLIEGEGTNARLQLTGHLNEFPFENGKGLFRITLDAHKVRIPYAQGWPELKDVEGSLLFQGDRMEVHATSGKILNTQVGKTVVTIPTLSHANLLTVDGEVTGATTDFMQFVQQSPVNKVVDQLLAGSAFKGNASLKLKLGIPLSHAADTHVDGVLQFADNQIQLNDLPALDKATGTLRFTEKSIRLDNARANLLGNPAKFGASTDTAGVVQITGSGRMSAQQLKQQLGDSVGNMVQGDTDWQVLVTLNKQKANVVLSSTLKGMSLDLPAPLRKSAGDTWPLKIEKQAAADGFSAWNGKLGNIVSAVLRFQQNAKTGEQGLERGVIQLGNTAAPLTLPLAAGLVVQGNVPRLNLDAWQDWADNQQATSGNGLPLNTIRLNVPELTVANRVWHDVSVVANRSRYGDKLDQTRWSSQTSAQEFEGRVDWLSERGGLIVAKLKRLTLPKQQDTTTKGLTDPKQASRPPALDIEVGQFQYGDKKLGELKVLAKPDGADWRLQQVKLTTPEGALNMDGLWQDNEPNSVLKVNVHIDAQDTGKLLDRLGFQDALRRGKTTLDGQLAWVGSPFEPNIPTLTGKLTLSAKNGQFVKLDPGAGRLLGVMSLQSLPRRITLDFRDVFSEGLAFDEISATAKVQQGVMHTEDLKLVGPAVAVLMKGDVDMVRETQNLHVRVVPVVGDSVSVAAGLAMANPVVGLGTFLLQKLFRDPLGQMIAFEYDVTGGWSNPTVVKTGDGKTVEPQKPAP
ncbi:YhdP family protein [Leeia oryzae]|uniref:YhdP family protein n=1 Tax=Leeia oryzae TaxID=356662 RepID=UPI0014615877|nr:YhdP family protein [Leeia oryzae]